VSSSHLKDYETHQDIVMKMIKVAASITVEQFKAKELMNTKAAEAVKPFNLQIDTVPAAVTIWVKRVKTYLKFTGMIGAHVEEQQVVMFTFMDPELATEPKCQDDIAGDGDLHCR